MCLGGFLASSLSALMPSRYPDALPIIPTNWQCCFVGSTLIKRTASYPIVEIRRYLRCPRKFNKPRQPSPFRRSSWKCMTAEGSFTNNALRPGWVFVADTVQTQTPNWSSCYGGLRRCSDKTAPIPPWTRYSSCPKLMSRTPAMNVKQTAGAASGFDAIFRQKKQNYWPEWAFCCSAWVSMRGRKQHLTTRPPELVACWHRCSCTIKAADRRLGGWPRGQGNLTGCSAMSTDS